MRSTALTLAMVVLGCKAALALPDCAGPVEIGHARIMRVERPNDALVLRDGRAVHMEGIRFPHAAQDRAPVIFEQQAFNAIDAMARGQVLTVTAMAPKEDRYDRVRGQVFNEDNPEPWLQIALLKSGLARVEIAPDRTECAAELYAAEAQARAQRLGLWAAPNYQVRTPEQLGTDAGTFQIVEGVVVSADLRDGRAYLDFGPDWRTDFTVTVAPQDMANFRRDGLDPRDYQGKRIRVRGIVQRFNGPEIEIANPQQIEVLQ
ncbi:MAG: thermonuclease family protein [Alphaproteobacteria bacterium]|nr:thermonuclease family protein [Alphaproteobacteria bacterium]MBV9693249.1 thermonuclease family protein [Alphaproteobacteria bacterium]